MNFKEYYEHYLSLHQNLWCRRLHVLGLISTIVYVALVISLSKWVWLLLAPFVIYPFAWPGHFYFEKNKPAALSDPIKAKISDWVMLKDWILGRIER